MMPVLLLLGLIPSINLGNGLGKIFIFVYY